MKSLLQKREILSENITRMVDTLIRDTIWHSVSDSTVRTAKELSSCIGEVIKLISLINEFKDLNYNDYIKSWREDSYYTPLKYEPPLDPQIRDIVWNMKQIRDVVLKCLYQEVLEVYTGGAYNLHLSYYVDVPMREVAKALETSKKFQYDLITRS